MAAKVTKMAVDGHRRVVTELQTCDNKFSTIC